jgi:ubiquinol-cytochrome c reductase subunit 6
MGWLDYLSDLASSVTISSAYADQNDNISRGPEDLAGQMSQDSKDVQQGGKGTAQQRGEGATKGGASTSSPASGTDEESSSEKEANAADVSKKQATGGEGEPGHKPGDGGEKSGQVGREGAGPHGGDVKSNAGVTQEDKEEDDEEEADEDEEEEEEEPEDLKPKFEEGMYNRGHCLRAIGSPGNGQLSYRRASLHPWYV